MNNSVSTLIVIIVVLMTVIFISAAPTEPRVIEKIVEVPIIDTVFVRPEIDEPEPIYEVKGTHYNAVAEQCDESPLTTADMSHIDLEQLEDGELRWVALSRDMLSRWGGPFSYGDTIYVHHDQPDLRGPWIVHDCMNARYSKRIDFLMALGDKIPGKSRCILISKKPFVIERPENLL